jgi:hypothetical protein
MEKEIYIKKIIDRDEDFGFIGDMRKGRRDGVGINRSERGNRGSGSSFSRKDKGHGNHLNGGRRDGVGPHHEEGCNTGEKKYQSFKRNRFDHKMKTKMFTSKKELVEYVNKVGELGNKVDIYKIEDDLYKVVVVERYTEEKTDK